MVKYLIRSESLAYLCALMADDHGELARIDGDVEVMNYLFVKRGDKWIARKLVERATFKYEASDCEPSAPDYYDFFPDDLEGDAQTLWSMWANEVNQFILFHLEDSRWQPEERETIAALREYGLLKKMPFDSFEKADYFSDGVSKGLRRCGKDAKCINSAKATEAKLKEERNSPSIGALAWEVCTRCALYEPSLDKVEQCVASFSKKNYCRKGLDYFADHTDVLRCADEIAHVSMK